jgi:hypothetical protein
VTRTTEKIQVFCPYTAPCSVTVSLMDIIKSINEAKMSENKEDIRILSNEAFVRVCKMYC